MRLAWVSLLLFVFLSFAHAGNFNYSIELNEKQAKFTTIISLESETNATIFKLSSFFLPENAEIISIRDSTGKITDFSVDSDSVSFSTNSGKPRKKETVELKYIVKELGTETDPFNANFSLPASTDSEMEIEVKGTRILSFESTAKFSGEIRKGVLKLAGTGPAGFLVYYSDGGKDFDHFVLFNKSSRTDQELEESGVKEADRLYTLLLLLFGIDIPYPKIPLLVLEDERYASEINAYSEGVYKPGGLIVVNERIFKESGAAVILHESTHAFNAQVLKWNESNSAWFDEGMAKMVEDHVYELRGTKKSNLFLDDVNWIQGNMIYIRPPRGSITELKNYLETRDDYMENWSTASASPDMREFGYAFSELWVKEFVKERGIGELQKKYRELLEVNYAIESKGEFAKEITTIFEKELFPCGSQSGLGVEECVREINSFSVSVPEEVSVLKLGLADEEFESVGKIHELKKKILLEKVLAFRQKLRALGESLFSGIISGRTEILAGVGR